MKHILLTISLVVSVSIIVNAQTCNLPEITATSGAGTYCPDDEVTLTITGTLNDATAWQWYTGSCGGDIIADETGTSIKVKVTTKTVTYFVRGIGGCVANSATCFEIVVVLDDEPPIANCPDDIIIKTEEDLCEATVTYKLPTGTDNCSGDILVEQTEGLGSGESFPVGITTETYVLTDVQGNKSECSFTITVEDKQNPVITCPADIEVKNDEGECGAVVTYKMPTATDNCTENEKINIKLVDEDFHSGAFFPVGTTIVTYTATDEAGNSSDCTISVTVVDAEPPVIILSKNKTSKWPPNHKHFKIIIEDYIKSVTDNCPGVNIDDIIIDEVNSDEEKNGSGDGNTDDDIIIADDCKTVHLLAERSGNGNGRVYTVNLAVVDAHGNIGIAEIKAEIAHDQGKKSTVVDDGPVYIVNGCDIVEEEEVAEEYNEESNDEEITTANSSNVINLETYPNPFNNSFVVNFTPQEDDRIEIDLFTFSGTKVKNLFIGEVIANEKYSWNFDSDNLNYNLFLIVIKGRKSHAIKKIVHR